MAYPSHNTYLSKYISALISNNDTSIHECGDNSRTDLDSHTNMVVFDKHGIILNKLGRYVDGNPFTPNLHSLQKCLSFCFFYFRSI